MPSHVPCPKTASSRASFPFRAVGRWILLGLVSITACAPQVRRLDWTYYNGPGAEYFHQEEIESLDFVDSIEPFNRTMGAFNDGLILGVVDPLSQPYRALVPRPAREAITRFGTNLLYPRRVLANLFQGKFREAGNETRRFLLNTTVGVLGFFDPASKYGIEPSNEDFGQALAYAGWNRSRYLCVPFYGPSTGRDAVGLIPDTLTDPANYLFSQDFHLVSARTALAFNDLTDSVEAYKQFTRTNHDPYALARIYWLLNRDRTIANYKVETEGGPAVESLQAIFQTNGHGSFPSPLRTGWVRLESTGRKLPYNYRLQPRQAAPLVCILPGLGAHRESRNALTLAEMVYREGYSVAIISSAFNWEFMERASTVALPSHAPVDAWDVHVTLDAVARDLDREFPNQIGSRYLMGYSMGAFHAFYIAASERHAENKLIRFDGYVTLDAPVNLIYSAKMLDAFYNAPLAFPPEQRQDQIRSILRKALDLGRGELKLRGELPFTEIEAKFLIGLSFRLSLQSVIYDSQLRHDLGVLQTKRTPFRRSAAYEEIFDYSFMEYVYAFVLPYYRGRDTAEVTIDQQLFELNDLRSIGDALRANGKIRHIAHADDFLLAPEDIDWLTDTLGPQNVTVLARGGHLGGLYKPEVQQEILRALKNSDQDNGDRP